MPVALSYPGVYIEELPSGVRSIAGVATSITAFVGRAQRGPIDQPQRISSFAEYERKFGGLWTESTLSFAVYQYFQNGGGDALIVRVHNAAITGSAALPLTGAAAGTASFNASSPGSWAARVRVRVDHELDPDVVAANVADTMFNLRIKDLATGVLEIHRNVSITAGHARFVSAVLEQGSDLLRGPATLAARPGASDPPAATASDPFEDPSAVAVTVAANGDGAAITAAQLYSGNGLQAGKQGLYALEHADLVNLMVIPPFSDQADLQQADWDA
ncbi:MAG TPA: hypothetical protein VK509_07690, partial [Polyangiales bacterium]|nr:hypothetical protein [Polyangiales bacterium]